MSSTLHTVKALYPMGWVDVCTGSKDFCEGWITARTQHSPHPAMQVIAPTGRWWLKVPACDDVSIGQVAGFPTAEQYEAAAQKALDMAQRIRERLTRQSVPPPI